VCPSMVFRPLLEPSDKHEAESAAKRARVRAVASDLELYLPAIDERLTQISCPMQS
jgi:hypothetical protein